MTLAEGVAFVDLRFLGRPGLIATGVLTGPDGVALVDPGPSTPLATLEAELDGIGIRFFPRDPADCRAQSQQ